MIQLGFSENQAIFRVLFKWFYVITTWNKIFTTGHGDARDITRISETKVRGANVGSVTLSRQNVTGYDNL